MSRIDCRCQRGLTLIELVMFIVVVAVGVAGVLAVFIQATRGSADPVVRKQAIALGESMLEEISSVPYVCPAGATCGAVTDSNRGAVHAIADYNTFSTNDIRTYDNTDIPQLDGYSLAVAVVSEALNGAPGSRITITVSRGNEVVTLEGWRGQY